MKTYKILKITSNWTSTNTLIKKVEQVLNEKTKDGFEIVSVSFGINSLYY